MESLQTCQSERVMWLDSAKAIGVVLVVLGHFLYGTSFGGGINRAIYSFHMPMFFIAAGFVSRGKTKNLSWLKKRFFRVLLPALIWEVLIETSLAIVLHNEINWSSAIYLYGQLIYNAPIWFFICLFCVEILILITDQIKSSTNWVYLLEICIALIFGFLLYINVNIPDYFGFKKVIIAFAFYRIGEMLNALEIFKSKKQVVVMGICSSILWFVFGVVLNGKVSFYGMKLGNYLFFIASGLFGSVMMFAICHFIPSTKWSRFLCDNSIVIVATHYPLVSVFGAIMGKIGVSGTIYYDLILIPFLVIVLVAYRYVACPIINKYLPILNGKKTILEKV